MYHIVASDLDGTLLSPEYFLTTRTKEVIRLLVSKGIHFVIATGRHYNEAIEIKKMLNTSTFLITSNGARIHNPNNELIYSCDIDNEIIKIILKKYLLDKDILVQVYSHNNWYVNQSNCKILPSYSSFFFKKKILKLKHISNKNISKVLFICEDTNKLLFIKKSIIEYWGKYVNASFSFPTCLEVMSKIVSKGNALKLVANLLGFSLQDCISFGDGMNDKEMLDMSGKGCIMLNSHYVLKNCLPNLEIIGSNKNDSVAEYLNNIYCKNNFY